MIALDTQITLPAIRLTVARAWSWWIGELAAAVPGSLRRRLAPERPEFVLDIGIGEATLSQVAGAALKQLSAISFAADRIDGDIAGAKRLLQTPQKPRLRVRLSRALVLRRELDLPRSAQRNLRQIVGLDLDRQTPLTAETAAFDAAVRGRDSEAGRIHVALVAAKRETVTDALALCRRLGVHPASIGIAGSAGISSEFNLLEPTGEAGKPIWRRPWMVIGAAFLLLVVLNMALAFGRLDTRAAALSRDLTKTRKEAQTVEKLRAQLTRSQSEQKSLGDLHDRPRPLDVLREVTRILPDDVWLFQFDVTPSAVEMSGIAPSASDLIEKLDKSALFSNPRFKSAITRADRTGGERFAITVDLRRQAAK